MKKLDNLQLVHVARRLRLDTLVRLRWLAVAGQFVTVLGVHFGLGYRLPLAWCLALIALSVWLNIGLRLRYQTNYRLTDEQATVLLAFDISQLAGLLFLTGGLANPFALLFLAPIMISAAALTMARTLALGTLAGVLATLLLVFHLPLPWGPTAFPKLPLLYEIGNWFAMLLGIAFSGIYAGRVAAEARRLAEALAATELILSREHHLSRLDGLAAAAAHELGTPLATIALVAREMEMQVGSEGALSEDIALLRAQVARCRTILAKLGSLDNDERGPFNTVTLHVLLDEAAAPLRSLGPPILLTADGVGQEPVCLRNAGLLYGLSNIIENATDYAVSQVAIQARWTPERVTLDIMDDGPGFSATVLANIGEPYLSSQDPARRAGGFGLGLFIAKSLIERTGGSIHLSNRPRPASGANVRVTWTRAGFDSMGKA
ncbi:MAG: ActS/PrrB/RegB family redox-sensitive histidine kinase [Bosea sp. (in: a-proteobacteria)]